MSPAVESRPTSNTTIEAQSADLKNFIPAFTDISTCLP
jgi:hypothetical protein